jgi:hypothetical protein
MFESQEFATRSKDQVSLLLFHHAVIDEFGYKARAKLIEKWLTLGREQSYDRKELIHEIDELENVITTLLGKNILPKFPFIVLSVLQAYHANMTSRPEAGCYGYVYEVLITTALAVSAKSPSDIDMKYTLLSRLAYHMFKHDVDSLSREDLTKVFEEYFRIYGLRATTEQTLQDLLTARVLLEGEGSYRFPYDYYVEYFVARYYKDALQAGGSAKDVAYAEVCNIADQIYWPRYSRIIMFLLYFSKNADLMSRLLRNAGTIFEEYALADLSHDVDFANTLYRRPPIRELPSGDVRTYREQRRESLDKAEKQSQDQEGEKVQYSKDLVDSKKIGIAIRHVELLGQILRNFTGSLMAEIKLDIATCTYAVGLRTMSVVLRLVGKSLGHYRGVIAEAVKGEKPELAAGDHTDGTAGQAQEPTPQEWRKLAEHADLIFILLSKMCVLGFIKILSFSVGSRELDQTYKGVLDSMPDSIAVNLIDLSIRLDHFRTFPQDRVRELHRLVGKNLFVRDVLNDLVIAHFMRFEVDRKIRQSMAALLGFQASSPLLMDPGRKLLKPKETGA